MKIHFFTNLILYLTFGSLLFSQDYSITNIPYDLLENSNAIIRWEKTTTKIDAINSMQVNYDLVVTILNESGSDFGMVGTYYSPDEKINCEVKIYNALGNEVDKFKKKDFEDQSVNRGYEISDNRMLFLNYKSLKYPYTIHYHYETSSPTTAFINDFHPPYSENVAIEKSEYEIINTTDIKLNYKVYNPYKYEIQSEESEPSHLKYSITNYSSFKDEPFSPRIQDIMPHVEFSLEKFNLKGSIGNSETWQSFGKWMYDDFLIPTSEISESMKNEFQNVISSAKNDHEKVALLYEYLQDNMRYISVQLGVGGWKPMYPKDVEKYKYGDCKALTNYLKNALESVGIPANYTVLYSNDDFLSFDENFPIMQGNHVMLNVPLENDRIWLECTSQDLAYNYISTHNDNRYVLSVNENGGEIIKTPKFDASKSQEIIKGKLKIDPNGSLDFDASLKYTGSQYGEKVYVRYNNESQIDQYYKEKFEELPSLQLENKTFNNNKLNAEFTENIKGKTQNFAKKIGEDLLFYAIPYGKLDWNLDSIENRKFPFQIKRGIKDEFIYEIEIPSGYTINNMPEAITLTDDNFGEYSLHIDFKENQITVKRMLYLKDGSFEKGQYNTFVKFINKISEYDNTKLYLEKL